MLLSLIGGTVVTWLLLCISTFINAGGAFSAVLVKLRVSSWGCQWMSSRVAGDRLIPNSISPELLFSGRSSAEDEVQIHDSGLAVQQLYFIYGCQESLQTFRGSLDGRHNSSAFIRDLRLLWVSYCSCAQWICWLAISHAEVKVSWLNNRYYQGTDGM